MNSIDAEAQTITTVAGNHSYGYSGDGGPATAAQMSWPIDIAIDPSGNIFISDHDNNVIRMVNSAGMMSTYAGNGSLGYSGDGGPATAAKLYHPSRLALDPDGNLYFSDQNSDVIRKIDKSGIITTVKPYLPPGYSGDGGSLAKAQFYNIAGLSFDKAGNLYISDYGIHVIRKVDKSGVVSTVAGNGTRGASGDGGPALKAQLSSPYSVRFDAAGNMYIPDHGNHKIRKVDLNGIITTYAGSGVKGYSGDGGAATSAALNAPWYIAFDSKGALYISDVMNNVVRKVAADGTISTFAGNGTFSSTGENVAAVQAGIAEPVGLAADQNDNLYVVDRMANILRKISNCRTAIVEQQPVNVSLCGTGDARFYVQATDAISYQWQANSGGGWQDLDNNTTYSGTASSQLSVQGASQAFHNSQFRCLIQNSCGSIYTVAATLSVVHPMVPSLTISTPENTICSGSSLTFKAIPSNADGTQTYQWFKNGLPVISGSDTYSSDDFLDGDRVSCQLTASGSCMAANQSMSNEIVVTVKPNLTPAVTIKESQNNICSGTPVTFNAYPQNEGLTPQYQWKLNGVVVASDKLQFSPTGLKDGDLVQCILTPGEACVTQAATESNLIQMQVAPLLMPAITLQVSELPVCPGSSVTFKAAVHNEGAAPIYQWQRNGLPVGTNEPDFSANDFSGGDVISCLLTSSAGCLAVATVQSSSVTVTVRPNPTVLLDPNPGICTGSSRLLDAGAFNQYLWDDGSTSRTRTISHTGVYSVRVTDRYGCIGYGVTKVSTLYPMPTAFLPSDTALCVYESMELRASGRFSQYNWSTGSGSAAITVERPGTYWLEVKDRNDCTGRDSVVVAQKQCLQGLYVPTGFSPNNDGRNDQLKAFVFGNVQNFLFTIYNRWGEVVYQSTDHRKGWDGTFKGRLQDTNVYIWTCSYRLEGGPRVQEKGTVSLLR